MCIFDCNWLSKEPDNLSVVIGYGLAFLGAGITFIQWRRDQRWKKKELIISRINAFNDTPGAHNAQLMLDWAQRDVPLWAKSNIEDCFEKVERKEVATALIPDNLLTASYLPKESAIRDSFEDYLVKLSHLEIFLETNLLDDTDVGVIMQNLCNSLDVLKKGDDDDQALLRHLYIYIEWRKFPQIKTLFKRFIDDIDKLVTGYTLKLKTEIADGKWDRSINFHKDDPKIN